MTAADALLAAALGSLYLTGGSCLVIYGVHTLTRLLEALTNK